MPPQPTSPTSLSAARLFRAWQPFDIQIIFTNSELDPVETFFQGRRGVLGIESKAEIEDGSDGWREGEELDGGRERSRKKV